MKQNQKESSTLPQISEPRHIDMFEEWADDDFFLDELKRPNPPTPEAIKKAQFVDKTYVWSGK